MTAEFLRLIDAASAEAERVRAEIAFSEPPAGLLVSADDTLISLARLRELALTDQLPRPSRGQISNRAGLSISRGIGEWTEDDRLREAAYALEDYFRKSL